MTIVFPWLECGSVRSNPNQPDIMKTLISEIASRVETLSRPLANDHRAFHQATLDALCKLLPSGSGFDAGTSLQESTPRKIVFQTSFHHMNDRGMYNGWTEHRVTVMPDFGGFTVKVSGSNRNGIKEYIADTFHHALSEDCSAEIAAVVLEFFPNRKTA